MTAMQSQAERFGAELITDDVPALELAGPVKRISTTSEGAHLARTVIVATGSRYKELGLPNEKRLSRRGVCWCATCDGFFFRDQDVVVVGGGDSALEEATFLTRYAASVTLIHRRDTLRASKIMQNRAFANPKITFLCDSEPTDVLGEDKVTGLAVRNRKTGAQSRLAATGIFVAIGHEPRSELVRGWLELDDAGYILVDHPPRAPTSKGSSRAGTWWTTRSDRRSHQRAQVVRRPWTPRGISPDRPTDRGPRPPTARSDEPGRAEALVRTAFWAAPADRSTPECGPTARPHRNGLTGQSSLLDRPV